MDKLEYWFLDTAVEQVIGFSWVVPDEQYGELAINRAPLNLSVVEITDVLYSLFHKGDLLAITPLDLNEFGYSRGFKPSKAEIEAALEERIPLFYFLTMQGGERWESVSKPKWEQYFKWVEGVKPIDEGYIHSANRELVEMILALYHLLPPDNCCSYLIPGTKVWEKLTPWKATYWKTLPIGFRVCYQKRTIEIDEVSEQSQELIEEERQAKKWLFGIQKWYTDYFKYNNEDEDDEKNET